jgi:hypothetical protein
MFADEVKFDIDMFGPRMVRTVRRTIIVAKNRYRVQEWQIQLGEPRPEPEACLEAKCESHVLCLSGGQCHSLLFLGAPLNETVPKEPAVTRH